MGAPSGIDSAKKLLLWSAAAWANTRSFPSLSAKPAASNARGAHQDAHWIDDASVDPADDAACRFRSAADGHRYFL